MLQILAGLMTDIWALLLAMSPYLIFGFGVAGILKVLIPEDYLVKHLAGRKWGSVFKAAFIGVPLPLCSCGVIPVTAHLKKAGAGRGAIISFLTSTPTTGVDSIFATYSLLGWIFVFMRVLASFSIGIIAGLLSNIFVKDVAPKSVHKHETCGDTCELHKGKGVYGRIRDILDYAYVDLIDDVGKWLIIGIVAGGLISYFVPTEIVETYFANPWVSYTFMLLLGIPTYVCATGSIPIAASLIIKGMSPGAGLVFLISGPATNTATISFVGGKLGGKTLFIYLTSIIIGSVGFGLLVDFMWPGLGQTVRSTMDMMHMLPSWLEVVCAVVLLVLVSRSYVVKLIRGIKRSSIKADVIIKVADMTCEHCKKTIEAAVSKIKGVEKVMVDLKDGTVNIKGKPDKKKVIKAIEDAGYSPENE
ncbi:MAG: SO_0444 family Cu/Zn efflux transporter [bacterium]